MFKNILLAVDGSDHSFKAARLAGDLTRCLNADLTVITVFDPVPNYLGETNLAAFVSNQKLAAENILNEALNLVGDLPGKLVKEVLEGPVAEAVLRVAEVRGNDLIIMGTRGLGRLAGALLGSQSQKVVAHAKCPVLLVR